MGKPQVGICSMWYEGNPCNMHLLSLAEEVKKGVVSSDSSSSSSSDLHSSAVAVCVPGWQV